MIIPPRFARAQHIPAVLRGAEASLKGIRVSPATARWGLAAGCCAERAAGTAWVCTKKKGTRVPSADVFTRGQKPALLPAPAAPAAPHPRQHPSCPPRWENDILGCTGDGLFWAALSAGIRKKRLWCTGLGEARRQPAPAHRAFPRRAPEKTPKPGVVLPAVPLGLGRGFTHLGLSFYCRGPAGLGQQGPCQGGRQVGSLGVLHPCSTTLGCCLNVFSFLSRSPALPRQASARLQAAEAQAAPGTS